MKITIFIDVQNDFISGSLGVDKDCVISERILEYAKLCKENGTLTIATQDTHDLILYRDTLEGKKLPVLHCIEGREGHRLFNNMNQFMDRVVQKQTFMSADLGQYVDDIAKNYTIDEIEICGFCTSICVISNALYLRGILPNTKISIIENLCGDVNRESHDSALAVAKNCQIDIKTI